MDWARALLLPPADSLQQAITDFVLPHLPRGGRLGVYRVMREGVMCLLEEGVAMAGARVQGFALNPVSIGASGRIAARMLLDDGRQVIASLG